MRSLDRNLIEAGRRLSLPDLIRSDGVALARRGREFIGLCPFHEDKRPSLTVVPEKQGARSFYHCFACGAHGDAIGWRMARHGEDFASAVAALAAGTVRPGRSRAKAAPPFSPATRVVEGDSRVGFARELWQQARRAKGTAAEAYLRERGLILDPPPSLRFITALRHAPTATDWPVMIAGVQAPNGEIRGVHRTYLRPDGSGKAPVSPAKMMLGAIGGGAVRLDRAAGKLAVGEGIETCLAFQQATGIPTWAALSTGGMRTIVLPSLPIAAHVYVVADNDPAGESAAASLAQRMTREGRRVTVARAAIGKDINDALLEAVQGST